MTTEQTKLSPTQVSRTVEAEQKGTMPLLPLQFTKIEDLTTFAAEVTVTDGDAVYHFYATEEVNALPRWNGSELTMTSATYWAEFFPKVMEAAAREYFDADESRLRAAYTAENASWWLRAKGVDQRLDPQRFALGFCEALDKALEGSMLKAR